MDEYIKREEALQQCSRFGDYTAWSISDGIGSIQAADVAPVVHGRWIDILNAYIVSETGADHGNATICSVCLYINLNAFKTSYCPNCGAKMDEGRAHND